MPSIVYVQPDGSRQTITADVGSTVMATAMKGFHSCNPMG